MLIESPFIEKDVAIQDVLDAAHAGSKFTMEECVVVARIANVLRPFTPKQVPLKDQDCEDGEDKDSVKTGTRAPVAHFALRAPIVVIANQ
ncbi:hypothetical protein BGX27_007280, partial [Mortierella sp. AM989]